MLVGDFLDESDEITDAEALIKRNSEQQQLHLLKNLNALKEKADSIFSDYAVDVRTALKSMASAQGEELTKEQLDELPPESSDRLSLIPDDAPPIASDAEKLCRILDQLMDAIDKGDTAVAVANALAAGYLDCQMNVRKFEEMVMRGRTARAAQSAGGKGTRKASLEEKRLIIQYRDKLATEKKWSKAEAARQISAQLRTGRFPGIDRKIDYEESTLSRLSV